MSQNFNADKDIGEYVQEYLIKILQDEFPGIHSVKGNFSAYDLIDNNGYTIEVKFDRKSQLTNNVAIEYKYKGKPSGISTTEALEWIQVFYANDWVYSRINPIELKSFIKQNHQYLKRVRGGDNNASSMMLINVDDFINTFDCFHIESKS